MEIGGRKLQAHGQSSRGWVEPGKLHAAACHGAAVGFAIERGDRRGACRGSRAVDRHNMP